MYCVLGELVFNVSSNGMLLCKSVGMSHLTNLNRGMNS